ncbi:MAG: FAD-dependent oxidoreductase [Marmoricola sp.]
MTQLDARPAGAGRPFRVAVVGAGPAGLYTADGLTFDTDDVRVDLIERLASPFGLLRFGVAPDHLAIRGAASALQEVLDRPAVRLFCNVEVGTTVSVETLRQRYDAVVYATGADADRTLGVLGEELAGSVSATELVKWYTGHPEAGGFDLSSTRSVVVVGAGNVALDVTRMLVKDPRALEGTDLPEDVLVALRRSAVSDVHILVRRGPEHARFSTKELREFDQLDGVDLVVDPGELGAVPTKGLSPVVRRNLTQFGEWAAEERTGAPRRVHFHFRTSTVAIEGDGAVSAVRASRAHSGDAQEAVFAADLVVRAVGYRSRAIPGIPFAVDTHTIPHEDHRVLRGQEPSVGEYAVGWAKRGPTGVLGRSRSDADDTVGSIRADRDQLIARGPDPGGAADLLSGDPPSVVPLTRTGRRPASS